MPYSHIISSRRYLIKIIKQYLFNIISKKSLDVKISNIVLRTNDVISVGPILFGEHEPHLDSLFRYFSLNGNSDYFIDVGSNIGLSVLNITDSFKNFYLYEPNPLAFKMLELNCFTLSNNVNLFNYGIGRKSGVFELVLPKHNWGGAYISDANNSYDNSLLLSKDRLSNTQDSKKIECKIECGKNVFDNIVIDLVNKYNRKTIAGLIKIDVEGYELEVLHQISLSKLMETRAIIVFENLSRKLDAKSVYQIFGGRIKLFKVLRTAPYSKSDSSIIKLLKLGFSALFAKSALDYSLIEIPYNSKDIIVGDLVAIIQEL